MLGVERERFLDGYTADTCFTVKQAARKLYFYICLSNGKTHRPVFSRFYSNYCSICGGARVVAVSHCGYITTHLFYIAVLI